MGTKITEWRKKKLKENPKLCTTCLKKLASPGLSICDNCREEKRNHYLKLKQMVFNHYGNSCACCGENNPLFLTIDHINNDGFRWKQPGGSRPSSGRIYLWLINNNFPEGFQLLCMNCNWGKARNNGICPHEAERKEGDVK